MSAGGEAIPPLGGCVAVLGGTGFVGRSVCQALLHHGYDVIAIARGHRDLPCPVASFDLVNTEVPLLAELLAAHAVTVVINAAGGMWGLSAQQMVDANLTLTQKALAAAHSLSTHIRFVQVGTVHEYGLVPVGQLMWEEMTPQPIGEYGRVKLRSSQEVIDATKDGLVDGVTVRLGNVVGAGQPNVSLLGVVAGQLWDAHRENTSAVIRTASLESQRDFVTLTDAVAAIVAVATIPRLPDTLFNVGSGDATSARTMVELLIDISGVPASLVEDQAGGGGESMWQRMCIQKAQRLLGWSPVKNLEEGVAALWKAYADGVTRG